MNGRAAAAARVAARVAAIDAALLAAGIDPALYGSGATWRAGRLSLSLEAAERLLGLAAPAPAGGPETEAESA